MEFKQRTLDQIASMIGGGTQAELEVFFPYRSSSYITKFFQDADTDYAHYSSSSRLAWIADTLREILQEPHPDAKTPPATFSRIIQRLMDLGDGNENGERPKALETLNKALAREGFEGFYAEDKQCHLRHIATNTIATQQVNPHRPFSAAEIKKRHQLIEYLNGASEDELIEQVLLPLFRQLGFHRVTVAGHKDKQLEYGKDVWMKYILPTQHVLYFGLQAKKGKLDSSGGSSTNVAEIHNQVTMMLGHEIFDPETNRKVLVDHAFIVAGGDITKAARNWLGGKLDAEKRSQIIFMDRDDILNLFVVTSLPVPGAKLSFDDELPF